MRDERPISPELKEQIHFNTLQAKAKEVIAKQAQHTWTDTAEHDPGITMLDAMAYNVSDLAYRHVLPIADLLTQSVAENAMVEESWQFKEELTADKPVAQRKFGVLSALSADGSILVIANTSTANASGIVYIYEQVNGRFVQRQKLTKSDVNPAYNSFGYSIGVSRTGDRIAIGAPESADSERGRIVVFERNGADWKHLDSLMWAGEKASDKLGTALSLSTDGKTVAGACTTNVRKVYIFREDSSSEKIEKDASEFGYSLRISSDAHWLAVSTKKTIDGKANAGSVFLYECNDIKNNKWIERQEISMPNPQQGAEFGSSLSFDEHGKKLAIGTPGDLKGEANTGAVYIYRYNGKGQWQFEDKLYAVDAVASARFGHAVRFSGGNTLAISANKTKVGDYDNAGAVYIFRLEGNSWNEVQRLTSPTAAANAEYGQSLAISADNQCLVVGAPTATTYGFANAGAVYVSEVPKKNLLFPEAFGPHQALTCSPITLEDYRRALLDLVRPGTNQFYFRNIQLQPIHAQDSACYQYGYDATSRQFTFQTETEGNSIEKKSLLGDYLLHVELSRDIEWNITRPVLDRFLLEHRNLGESIRKVHKVSAVAAPITATIELEDDVDDIAPILAQIYTLTENYLSPPAVRERASDLAAQGWSAEAIYQGPQLKHGWITHLPAERDYSQAYLMQLTPLVKLWEAIPGVQAILSFASRQEDNPWAFKVNELESALAFSSTPIQDLAQGKWVCLLKRGRQMITTEKQINDALPAVNIIEEASVVLPAGRYRNLHRYYPASLRLPACYQLQNPDYDAQQTRHLHQFLLAFEQQLANGCDQLARLPALLSFARQEENEDKTKDAAIWGAQWPFGTQDTQRIPNEVPNALHKPYRDRLEAFNQHAAGNTNKELDIIDYLLSYFGERRASRALLSAKGTEAQMHRFLAVQRGYLQQITELTYHRAAIRVDQVSALQRRIAARLGWASELFDEEDLNLANLPFYIVERRALLPKKPTGKYNEPQDIVALIYEKGEDGTKDIGIRMAVKDGVNMDALTAGQLIDFTHIQGSSDINTLLAVNVISEVDASKHTVLFLFANNANLEKKAYLLWKDEDPASDIAVRWKSSQDWLYNMVYTLEYADPVDDSGETRKLLVRPFPAYIKEGATLTLYKVNAKQATPQELSATIEKVDPLLGQVTAKMSLDRWNLILPGEERLWHWSFVNSKGKDIQDYFSFMVSVVMDRTLLTDAIDPQATAAWIEEVILEEMPAHIVPCIHWLDKNDPNHQDFSAFAKTYAAWQNDGQPLGDLSYKLLELLGIGSLDREVTLGIGTMRVATATQKARAEKSEGILDETYIQDYSLLHVPIKKEGGDIE